MKRAVAISLTTAFVALAASAPPSVVSAEQIGKVSQPIIVGDEVSVRLQRELGLVIVGGGCSGTLLNRYWVLTADHCVSTDGTIGGPDAPYIDSRITAYWTSKVATPTQYVRYAANNNLDVALIYLGAGDLGPADRKLIYHNQVDDSMTLTKFGIGFCGYASGVGDAAQPAEEDCGYRSARLTPYAVRPTEIEYRSNATGQISSFGDSGGPDFVTDGNGNLLGIAGVTSSGRNTYLPGKPQDQKWVNREFASYSVALLTIRDDIQRHMRESPLIARNRVGDDLIVSRDTGVVTKGPSSYGDAIVSPGVGVVSKRPSSYSAVIGGAGQAPSQPPDYGPTCLPGFVWRAAAPSDLVCVTPEARDRVAEENATAPERWRGRGEDDDHICRRRYVYREAFAGDDVCVTPESYDLVQEENAEGPRRRVQH